MGRRLFVEQQLFFVLRRQDEMAIEALKVARDAFFEDGIFDAAYCGAMTLGGKARPSFSMEPFYLGIPIIDDVGEMSRRSAGFPAADEAILEHDDRGAVTRKQIGGRQSCQAASDHADIG
jgi:hypothetical protein